MNWERRHEAFKAIHDKIAEVLARLHDVIISAMPYEGTITHFSKTATADVKTVSGDKKLKVLGWNFYCDADIICELRFKTSGNVIAGIPSKGINAMAKSSINRPLGAVNEAVEIYLSGTGNVKGWISTKEV